MSKLPKLYRVVEISFWSIRPALGSALGFTEVDEFVTRKARRVLCADGWKWQIANLSKIAEWDCCVETDQEYLDEYINDCEGMEIKQ